MNPSSELFGLAILVATFLGPIAAVIVTRFVDGRRDKDQRRMWVFRALMANRASVMNPDRIAALNVLQIEFSKDHKVLVAWSNYMKNLALTPREEDQQRVFRDREHLFTTLLHEIAKVLRIKIEQLEIMQGGYYPVGATIIEEQQAAVRQLFADIAMGKRVLPIVLVNPPKDVKGP